MASGAIIHLNRRVKHITRDHVVDVPGLLRALGRPLRLSNEKLGVALERPSAVLENVILLSTDHP